MMICMSDLRPGILLHLVFLQRALSGLQRTWEEDVNFDFGCEFKVRRRQLMACVHTGDRHS
jgi:hypothetical protein